MKMAIAAVVAILVSACSSLMPPPFDLKPLQAKSHTYEGRHVNDLLLRLGAPNHRERIGPATWFAWEFSSMQDTGVGISQWQCRFSAAVDDAGVVVQVTSTGNVGGCRTLLGRL